MAKMDVSKDLLDTVMVKMAELQGAAGAEQLEVAGGNGKGRHTRGGKVAGVGNGGGSGKGSGSGGGSVQMEVDSADISSVLNLILMSLNTLIANQTGLLQVQNKKICDLEEKVQVQDDLLDEYHQRSIKGCVILTSPVGNNKTTLVKSADTLLKEKVSVTDHACDLLKKKFGVELPQTDIIACHHLPNQNILVKIINRKQGSAWSKLTSQIMQGGNRELNLFANFMMTPRRNKLLFHLRTMKKAGSIAKFYSNENGQIGFKVKPESQKTVVTLTAVQKYGTPRTLSVKDIDALIKV